MKKKSPLGKLLYWARDLRSQKVFAALQQHCGGRVLDVGGWDFYKTAIKKDVHFDHWTILEVAGHETPELDDDRVELLIGDGCNMDFDDDSFETILNLQVLEHVYEPNAMMQKMARVLKPGGCLIMLIPQTAMLHMVPHHYYNFTRFWIQEALERNRLETVELAPLGGLWSSMASHLVHFLPQSWRANNMSSDEFKRPLLFYVLYPFMLLFIALIFPCLMLFSLGDLTEEPNNHLVVVRKPEPPA